MTKINKKTFKIAVEGTGGIMLSIANNLGCARQSVYEFCWKHPDMMELRHQEEEKIVDIAENGLFTRAKDKEQWAVKYILATKGKKRGYVEKTETEITGQLNQNIDLSLITMCKEYNESESNRSPESSGQSNKE